MRTAVEFGFRPLGPVHLCQDITILERFERFTYDVWDLAFLRYVQERLGLCLLSERCTPSGPLVPVPPERLDATQRGLDSGAKVWDRCQRIQKGQLQDAWEVYSAQAQAEAQKKPVLRVPVQMTLF